MSSDEIKQITDKLNEHAEALATLIADMKWIKYSIIGIFGGVSTVIIGLLTQIFSHHLF